MDYTKQIHGKVDYVFARETDPKMPYSVQTFREKYRKLIEDKMITDDRGNLLTPKTHIFRRTFSQELTEQHIPDFVIAALCAHSNQGSLKNYRRVGFNVMAEETKEHFEKIDSKIKDIASTWGDYDE